MSSGSGLSSTTTLTTVSSLSAANVPPPPVPASTALTPAVVSLLGSLVRNIVRLEMASASPHSPAGSVPPPPTTSVPAVSSAPPLVSTVHSSAPVVSSSTIPAGITSGMPLLCCVSHVRQPIPTHWGQLTIQWQVFLGGGVGLHYWDCFDHGHDCCNILPSLSCDRQVPVFGENSVAQQRALIIYRLGLIYVQWRHAFFVLLACKLSLLPDPTPLPFLFPFLHCSLPFCSVLLFSSFSLLLHFLFSSGSGSFS